MKKGTKILLIILGIILLCGVGAGGWFLGVKYANKEDSKKVEEKDKEKETNVEKEENKEIEQKTKESDKENKNGLPTLSIPSGFCGGVNFELQEKTINVKDISDEDKLTMLADVLLDFNKKEIPKIDYYDEEGFELDFDIMEVAQKYFDVTPSMEEIMNEGFSGRESSFVYKNGKSYYYFLPGGCEGPNRDGDELIYKGEKKEGNTIIKSYYYYYVVVSDDFVEGKDENGNQTWYSPMDIYKNKKDKKPVYKDVIDIEKVDLSSFNTYDMYFDTTGGNMKLIKIEFNKN